MMESRYSNLSDNWKQIRQNVAEAALAANRNPDDIQVMAVTKTQPADLVNATIRQGVTLLGENRAQELLSRYEEYDRGGVEIHFIGSLQTNKVRQIIDKVSMIQSVDSERLALEIQKQAAKNSCVMDILVEVNIGGEDSKSGIAPEELSEFAAQVGECPNLRLRGLMAIPPVCDQNSELEGYFNRMQQLFVDIKGKNVDNKNIDILSMGMSGDYPEAIRHGSTLVRIGSALFGARI